PEEELEIARRVANDAMGEVQEVASSEDLMTMKEDVKKIHIDEEVEKYIVDLIFATREPSKFGLESIEEWIMFGASPRASIDLYKSSRAQAYLRGKDFVSPVDIAYVAKSVLRHRIILSYEAEAEDITTDHIVDKVLETVAIP
ncbi:MAG: MoxR family ATPase, partial [Hydrogenimonas sp.]|nr:MoxR family ATPase [Hydrogenimonas sp.]